MNQVFARTYVDFWSSRVMELDDNSRVLAHFLFSGRTDGPWGLYYKPISHMATELRRGEAAIKRGLADLARIDFAHADPSSGYVWVLEMCAYQLKPLPLKDTNLLIKSARRWYAAVPRNPFLGVWFDRYDGPLHLSNPGVFPGSQVDRRDHGSPSPIEQPMLIENVSIAKVRFLGKSEFEAWFSGYPKQDRHKPALDMWLRKKIPADQFGTMQAVLEAQKQTRDWKKEGGKFVPLAVNYLKDERWKDPIKLQGRAADLNLNPTNEHTMNTLRDLVGDE